MSPFVKWEGGEWWISVWSFEEKNRIQSRGCCLPVVACAASASVSLLTMTEVFVGGHIIWKTNPFTPTTLTKPRWLKHRALGDYDFSMWLSECGVVLVEAIRMIPL